MAAAEKYAEPKYGVPHVKFERTDGGFKVSYRRQTKAIKRFGERALTYTVAGSILAFLAIFAWNKTSPLIELIAASPFILLAVWWMVIPTTVIVVDGDSVKIDRKLMRRSDFGNFTYAKAVNSKYKSAGLFYEFGREDFPIPGLFKNDEVVQVAAALNFELGRTPRAEELQASPEMLRANRPTDF